MKPSFYLYANPYQEKSAAGAMALCRAIERKGGRALTEKWLCQMGVGQECPLEEMPQDTRALIAFGGDGTLLRAAPVAAKKKIPVLGVHTGTVGFLMPGRADAPEETAEMLLGGQYQVRAFPLLKITYEGKRYLAVNDLALTRGEHPGVIEVRVTVDGEEAFLAHGDGVVVSTALGATAYGLSAGGPIVRHDAPCLLLTPLCARELLLRPVVLPLGARITLSAHGRERRRLQLAIDGQILLPVTHELKAEVSRAREKIWIIQPEAPRFFDTLRKKQAIWNQQEIRE